jgi:DNA invertase Pin-like site-specific DNA recombinase
VLKTNSLSVREEGPASALTVRVALYARVSTADQNCELQLLDLQDYAARQGWEITGVYQDVISGSKSDRPALDRLREDARARRFDCLLVWKLDRFGRSLIDCLNNIQILEDHGIRFVAVTQGLDTDQRNPTSRFLLHVLGAAAEFERALVLERTHAGRMRYQQDYLAGRVGRTVHSRSGRDLPPHRPRKIFDREAVICLHRQGLSMRQIARQLSLALGTVSRTLKACSKSTCAEKDGAFTAEHGSDYGPADECQSQP